MITLIRRFYAHLLLLLLALTLVSPAAVAQENGGGRGALEEITVTATRRSEDVNDIPVSVSAFTGETIESLGFLEAVDLERITPGLNIQGSFGQSAPEISIRGVGNNSFNANAVSAVGFYTDEINISQAIAHGLHLFDIERVEVLRGPQGTLYGANATGGAINIISRAAVIGEELNGNLTIGAGNFGEYRARGAISVPISDHIAARFAVTSNQNDGYRQNNYLNRDEEFFDTLAWRAQLLIEPSDELSVTIRAHGAENGGDGPNYEMQGTLLPGTFTPGDPTTLFDATICDEVQIAANACEDINGYSESRDSPGNYNAAHDRISSDNLNTEGLAVIVDWQLSEGNSLKSITAIENTDRVSVEDLDGSPFDVFSEIWKSDANQFSQEFRLTNIGARHNLVVGAFFLTEDAFEYTNFVYRGLGAGGFFGLPHLEGSFRVFDVETTSYSVFGDFSYDLNDSFSISGGLRYTDESKDIDYFAGIADVTNTTANQQIPLQFMFDNNALTIIDRVDTQESDEVTGRIALEFHPSGSDNFLGFASFTTGFRGGNFNAGAAFDASEFALVDPELVDSIELGFKATFWGGKAQMNTTVFSLDYTDQQVTTVQMGQQLFSNAAESTSEGIEVELKVAPIDGLFGQFSYAYLDAVYDQFIGPGGQDFSNNELEQSPKSTFGGLLRYEWPLKNAGGSLMSVQVDCAYKGDHFLDNANSPLSVEDSYFLVGARLSYSMENLTISAWGKNLSNEEYRINWFDVSSLGFNSQQFGVPKTYGVEVQVAF